MIINSNQLQDYSAYDLLTAAGRATLAIDQRWLHALIDHPEQTLPGILRFAAEDHNEDPIPLVGDLVSIFHYTRDPRGIPFLIGLIREQPDDISDEIVEALVSIGQPAIDPLLDLYRELGPEKSGEISFLLAGMGIKDPRILELLFARLDKHWDDGLFHMEVYGDPQAIPQLEKRIETASADQLLDLRDTIEDLRQGTAETVVSPFDIWEFYPDTDKPDYELASEEDRLELLTSSDPEQRADVIEQFFSNDLSPQVHAKLFDMARNDPDPGVRGRAWSVFFDKTDDPELRKTMTERFTDPVTPKMERAGLTVGLCRHSDQPVIHEGIEELAEDPETRELAVEAMWRSFDASFGPLVIGFIDDPNPDVRRNVIWAIGYLNLTKATDLLVKFFDDEDLRPDALHNYALASPGPTVRKKIPALLAKIKSMADGLTEGEEAAVQAGLDLRLTREGLPSFYSEDAPPEQEPVRVEKIGRNDPCPCGSGKKYKKCCGQ